MTTRFVSFRQCAAIAGAAALSVSLGAHAAGEKSFEVYGFAQADYIQDFKRVDPAWQDTLRPSKIPTTDGQFGSDGQAIVSVKQSRLGAMGSLPVGGNDLTVKIEFDFFGTGVDAGQTTIRLRHAYGEWGSILAGQTNSLFMDGDIFPNTIDYWGPAGMVFYRTPQLRWTPIRGVNTFAVAIEKPGNDIDPGQLRTIDDPLLNGLQADQKIPDFTAHFRTDRGWGHAQLAAIIRRVGYDCAGTDCGPNGEPKGSKFGWGLDATGHINTFGKDKVLLGVVYGEGIASYMNDGGTDLAPTGSLADPSAEAVSLLGVSAYYDHYWSDKLSSSVGFSLTTVNNTSLQDAEAFKTGEYASVNLLYTPIPHMLAGVEFLWGQRENNDGDKGTDARMQVSVKYSFSSKDFMK